jgi:hypothetical protein
MRRGEFYTELDIIDMVRAGKRSLELRDEDRITDVARERAIKAGFNITRPPTEASKRPQYQAPAMSTRAGPASPAPSSESGSLHARVKQSVQSQLGASVDDKLIDDVIRRVLDKLGVH